jgi:phosphatidylethanolamine-binding protein (PEBP) family uncharacterized protein
MSGPTITGSSLALDRKLGLGGTPSADQLRSAMEGHVLADTVLVGTYRR